MESVRFRSLSVDDSVWEVKETRTRDGGEDVNNFRLERYVRVEFTV